MAEKSKVKSKGFSTLGIPVGATLTFRKNPEITCKVVNDKNKVEYKGMISSISSLAKELLGTPISGYHAFKYNDVLLAKLGKANEEVGVKVTATTNTAPTSPLQPSQALETPKSTIPQAVPLPITPEAPISSTESNSDPLMNDNPL